MKQEKLISTTEAAKLLGISRIAVFNRIKKGKLEAKKFGRNYLINRDVISSDIDKELSDQEKKLIDKAVAKTIRDYSETLKKLADA